MKKAIMILSLVLCIKVWFKAENNKIMTGIITDNWPDNCYLIAGSDGYGYNMCKKDIIKYQAVDIN